MEGPTPQIATYVARPTPSRLPRARASALRAGDVGVAGQLDRPVEVQLVVPGVVGPAQTVVVGELLLRDQVLAPDGRRVHADLGGVAVDEALHQERGLGAPAAALGAERDGVGEGGVDLAEGRVDVVHPADGASHQGGGDTGADRRGVGAEVGVAGAAHGGDAAVAGACEGDVLAVVAALDGGAHQPGAGVHPFHGPSERLGQEQDQRHVGVQVPLGAEAAADGRGDHPELVEGDAEDQRGEQEAVVVRPLGGGVEGVLAGDGVVVAHRAARFDGAVDGALVDEVEFHGDLGRGDGRVGAVLVAAGPVRVQVAGDGLVQLGRAFGEGLVGPGDHGQGLVLDGDRGQCGGGLARGLGDDHGDGVAHVAHGVPGEHGAGAGKSVGVGREVALDPAGYPDAGQRHHVGEVGGGGHLQHAGQLLRRLGLDGEDPGVGHGAAQDRHVGGAGQIDVRHVLRLAAQQLRVLAAVQRLSEQAVPDGCGLLRLSRLLPRHCGHLPHTSVPAAVAAAAAGTSARSAAQARCTPRTTLW